MKYHCEYCKKEVDLDNSIDILNYYDGLRGPDVLDFCNPYESDCFMLYHTLWRNSPRSVKEKLEGPYE